MAAASSRLAQSDQASDFFNRERSENSENSLSRIFIPLIAINRFGTKLRILLNLSVFFAHFASFVCPAEAQGAKEGG
jgi:hypothetical protein